MIRGLILSLLAVQSALCVASEDTQSIRWLFWPVTGIPAEQVDEGIFYPAVGDRFSTVVERDVLIGLRADGVVVWKYAEAAPGESTKADEKKACAESAVVSDCVAGQL